MKPEGSKEPQNTRTFWRMKERDNRKNRKYWADKKKLQINKWSNMFQCELLKKMHYENRLQNKLGNKVIRL